MEIPKQALGIAENSVKQKQPEVAASTEVGTSIMRHSLIQMPEIKFPVLLLKELPENDDHFMIKIEPLHLFSNLEVEYNKVKDFSFKNIDVKDISNYNISNYIMKI